MTAETAGRPARRRSSLAREDLEILSTEHWSLLSTRSLGWPEMAGRTQMYLTALSGTVVGLALAADGTRFGPAFHWFALALLPPLLFIGIVTFVRLVYINREDARWLQGMNRIRNAYVSVAPAIAPHLVTGAHDDDDGLYRTYAADEAPQGQELHALFTTPGMVSVINAVIGGVTAGIAAQAVGFGAIVAALAAVAGFATLFIGHWRYQVKVLSAGTGLPAAFPADGRARNPPPYDRRAV